MSIINKNKKTGFTLVELLCAIVILGILSTIIVYSSYKLIAKTKKDSFDSQERLLIETTKSYIQEERDKAPKVLGESKNITLIELKDKNYLKDDVVDYNGNSCMKNSYVRVYKLDNKDYTYLAYIYCGSDKSDIEEVPTPTIKVGYRDSKYNNVDEIDSIINSKFYIELTGGISFNGNLLDINKYKYEIFIKNKKNDEYTSIYNSDFIIANRKQNISLVKDFKDYLEDDDIYSLKLKVYTENTVGGVLELSSYIQNSK